MDQLRRLYERFMLGAVFLQLDELDHIARPSTTITTEAAEGIRCRIDLQTGRFVRVERTAEPVVFVRLQAVISQHLLDG